MRTINVSTMLVLSLLVSGTAIAADGVLVPYHGYLEKDGVAQNEYFDIRVGIFTSGQTDNSCLLNSDLTPCGIWADSFLDILVVAGEFSLLMGTDKVLDSALFIQPDLYIAVALQTAGDANFTLLNGRQRIGSVPTSAHAMTSDHADTSTHADTSDHADTSVHADTSGHADTADTAETSTYASEATNFMVDGNLSYRVTREKGALDNEFYMVDRPRYVLEAAYTTSTPTRSYTRFPETILRSMCGDIDGCRITLRMKDWDYRKVATSISFHFHYGALVTGGTTWRREAIAVPSNGNILLGPEEAIDGDNAVNHIAQNHDCYFTDGYYSVGSSASSDGSSSLALINYNATGHTGLCQLIVDD